jgi:hypothetical protein
MIEDDEEVIARFQTYLEAREASISEAMAALFGSLPPWLPEPSAERARRFVEHLLNQGFKADDLVRLVREAQSGDLSFPGIVRDPGAFTQAIHELAHVRYAIARGKRDGLRVIAGKQAMQGQAFLDGRKPGTGGPVRKAIRRLLAKDPTMKNAQLWSAIEAKLPKGWEALDNKQGRYLEGPMAANMGYRRFCNVAAEERSRQCKKNITG